MNKTKEKISIVWHKHKLIIGYTILFAVIIAFLISILKKYGKSFIWNGPDGLTQHVVNLQNFRQLLIDFIKTGKVSTFTWNIGTGFDMFGNLAYYCFGDIFSYISVFFPKSKIEVLYNILIVMRMYFCGITFICYCKYKKMKEYPSLIGALMYTFCTFVLFTVRHPYFINAVIIFPLALMGIEKIVLENKKIFYTIIIAIMFMMNFYFAYMIAIILAIYGTILAIYTYRKEGAKKVIGVLLKTLLYSILGIMIAAIVLLPTAIAFLDSERTDATIYPYTITHYRNLFARLLNENGSTYWMCFGVQSISLIAIPIFIKNRKKNYPLFLLLIILFLPLLVAQIGSIFCGFGYPNNRWIFVISFIFSFMATKLLNDDEKIDKKALLAIAIFISIYLAWNIIGELQIKAYAQFELLVFLLELILMLNKEKFNRKSTYKILLTIIFVIGILGTEKFLYDAENSNYVSQFLSQNKLSKAIETSRSTISDFKKTIKYLNKTDKEFYRVGKNPHDFDNLPLVLDYKAIGSFYSITPKIASELSHDLNNLQYAMSYGMGEFDYRTKINTLLGVKYYINNGNNIIPYGYSLENDYKGKSKIYKNDYNLPFGVLYTKYITLNEYDNLSAVEKEDSLLKVVALEEIPKEERKIQHSKQLQHKIEKVEFEIIDKNKINSKNKIEINKENKNKIKLKVRNIKNKELYLQINGLKYETLSKEEVIKKELGKNPSKIEKEVAKNKYKWYQPNYRYVIKVGFNNTKKSKKIDDYITSPYYFEMPEILFNLGYYDEASGEIELEFSKIGTYNYDSIIIYAVSMEDYEQDIQNLRKSNFEVLDYDNNYLNGKVNSEENGILQFSTMYNKGWKVYVDGQEVKTLKCNKYFLGIEIEKGSHTVKLQYHNPYIIYGVAITTIGIMIFVVTIVYNRKKDKK